MKDYFKIKGFIPPRFSSKKSGEGFTLVEMIVAIGLFTIVMFVATGALLSVVSLNKKAQAQQSAINNLNYALENMARSIRTGSSYRCELGTLYGGNLYLSGDTTPADCANGSNLIYESDGSDGPVDPADGRDQRAFRLNSAVNSGFIEKSKDNGGNWTQITDPNVIIQNLTFVVTGTKYTTDTPPDRRQPQVRINISGYAFVSEQTGSPRRVDFNLQTLASQRKLDI